MTIRMWGVADLDGPSPCPKVGMRARHGTRRYYSSACEVHVPKMGYGLVAGEWRVRAGVQGPCVSFPSQRRCPNAQRLLGRPARVAGEGGGRKPPATFTTRKEASVSWSEPSKRTRKNSRRWGTLDKRSGMKRRVRENRCLLLSATRVW